MPYDPRYETRPDHVKRPCTGCGGFRWSAKGECLNEPCISDETRARIFEKPTAKKRAKKRGFLS